MLACELKVHAPNEDIFDNGYRLKHENDKSLLETWFLRNYAKVKEKVDLHLKLLYQCCTQCVNTIMARKHLKNVGTSLTNNEFSIVSKFNVDICKLA